ncbi:MAG TPA: magnesium transporter [Acholeplasma sp.]|nr:magnesium transporter [Acholeplasma sp.]
MRDEFILLNEIEQKAYLKDLHASDLADLYESLEADEQAVFFEFLTDEQKADILTYLEPEDAALVIEELEIKQTMDIFEFMEPDDITDILNELETETQDEILDLMDDETKEDIESLQEYDEDQAGSIMTSDFVSVTSEMDVKEAMKKLVLWAPNVETINVLFVIDKHETYLGVLPLKKLIKAKSPMTVSDLYEPSLFVYDTDDIEDVTDIIQENGIYAMPVLNDSNELVGMITLDDAIDAYEDEIIEDFQKLTMLSETSSTPAYVSAFKRLPWLILLMVLSLPIARLALSFEATLSIYTIIIILQPMILDSVGNAGTQTLTVSLIMLSDNEPDHIIKKNIKEEFLSGLMTGVVLSVLAFFVTMTFMLLNPSLNQNPFAFGLIVSVSVFSSMSIGTFASSIIPVLVSKLGLDPANASGPLITTVIDISTIAIYYSIASFVIGGLQL